MVQSASAPPIGLGYPHIIKRPDLRAGKACIEGTRIAVVDVVAVYRAGVRLEDICGWFSSRPLTLGEIHAALAYAYDNSAEIEGYFEREREVAERGEAIQRQRADTPPSSPSAR